ncbi:nuclear mRNA export, poly(A)+RNA binding protein [Tulasnella sp. 424]|nr:nuclear mRNA export, poly(A)+RNA binding protein [Tulasnella sp. 424]KAG8978094.1 nuclear mRNA export, poly(A)+RNA binding protein [Tulasnella sp. 425]
MFTTSNKPPATKAPAGLPSRPSTTGNRKGLASTLLKGSGLVDRDQDAKMADAGPSTGSAALHAKRADERRKRNRERMGIPEKDKTGRNVEQSFAAAMRLGKGSALTGRIAGVPSTPIPKRVGVRSKITATTEAPKDVNNISLLRGFVNSRYDKQRRFLNLENLQDDPFFKDSKFTSPDLPSAAKDTGTVILKLASQLDPPPETVSLANNKFRTLKQLAYINRYLPNLANLSLQNNDIEDIKTLSFVGSRSDHVPKLGEVIFLGNPFREIYSARNELERYQTEVLKVFPCLKMLDMQPVVKVAGFDASASKPSRADETGPTVFDTQMGGPIMQDGVQETTTAFLVKYFTLFDQNRAALVDAYSPNATFSVSINTAVPARARISRFFLELPHQKQLNWEAWTPLSRNLTRIKNTGDVASHRLFKSPEDIVKALHRVPQTKHDIANGGNTFLAESWIVSSVLTLDTLLVTVHGQFTELPAQGQRSFDRTFILAPAAPDSKARQNGWEVVIISEQLHVRNYSSHDAWAPGPITVQTEEDEKPTAPAPAPAPVPAPVPVPVGTAAPPTQAPQPTPVTSEPAPDAILAALPDYQRNLIAEFQRVTGLNVIWSGRCLEGNQWNPEAALVNFHELKPQIPPEAFNL